MSDRFPSPVRRIIEGNTERVKQFLEDGWDACSLSNRSQGHPLHFAAEGGKPEMVELVLKGSCKADYEDPQGRTPLARAVEHGHSAVAKLLLEAGADEGFLSEEEGEWVKAQPWFAALEMDRAKKRVYSPQSKKDQLAAVEALQQTTKLPVELVIQILDLAEYWICRKVFSQTHRTIQNSYLYSPGTHCEYLRSEPIIGKEILPVRKIVFHVTSRDQGWSDYTAYHGTYDESCTWFQAYLEPQGENNPAAVVTGPVVFSNVHALKTPKEHFVSWPHEEGCFWRPGRDEDEVKEWIARLKVGDRVVVLPHARYPGWLNAVHTAEMRIYTTFL